MAKGSRSAISVAKLQNARTSPAILNRFTGYSVADCECCWCRFYGGKKTGCTIDECCCLEERAQAAARENMKMNGGIGNEPM